jgi:hypothetical protein
MATRLVSGGGDRAREPPRLGWGSRFDDRDGPRRAERGGAADVVVQLGRRGGVEQDHSPVILALIEDRVSGEHALTRRHALVLVDDYSH